MEIQTKKCSPAYWRVIIDNPSLNFFDQEMFDEFQSLLTKLESDEKVKVVVFESANPDYFIAPADSVSAAEFAAEFDAKPEFIGLNSFDFFLERLKHLPFMTVGVLRGHARGAGSAFLLGMDIKFASREKAILSQIEAGFEFSSGTNGPERLIGSVGRERAMEIILDSEDLDADTAERLGLIDRSISDENLDEFVKNFVSRVSNFNEKNVHLARQITREQICSALVGDINQ